MFQYKLATVMAVTLPFTPLIRAAEVNPPLFRAAEGGDLREVRALVENGADPNTFGEKVSVLQIAAGKGYREIVTFLLDNGADINLRNKLGATALALTVSEGDAAIVELLIKRGANVNEKMEGDSTPLYFAAYRKGDHIKTFDLLLKGGADINAKMKGGTTILMQAVASDNRKIVARILDVQPDAIRDRDERGRTPLSIAQGEKRKEIESILRAAGAPR